MDHRLDRYQDQSDSEYATYLDDTGYPATPMDEATYLLYEIRGIEKILAIDDKHDLVTPEHWHERLKECRTRRADLLINEQASLQGTIDLHCQGLIQCNMRYLEIEAELKQVGVKS